MPPAVALLPSCVTWANCSTSQLPSFINTVGLMCLVHRMQCLAWGPRGRPSESSPDGRPVGELAFRKTLRSGELRTLDWESV